MRRHVLPASATRITNIYADIRNITTNTQQHTYKIISAVINDVPLFWSK